jgi:hypothetical protein
MTQQAAANYVMHCWIIGEGDKPRIVDLWIVFPMDCGAGPFVVTAGHV